MTSRYLINGHALIYVGIVFAVLAAAINYNNNPAYALGFLLLAVGGWALRDERAALHGLQLRCTGDTTVAVEQACELQLHLKLPQRAYRSLRVRLLDRGGGELAAGDCVLHDGSAELRLTCRFPQRGVKRIGSAELRCHSGLGFGRLQCSMPVTHEIVVHPRPRRHGEGDHGNGEDPHGERDDYQGHRSYQTGDPLQRVDWKAAARRDRLLVKDFRNRAAIDDELDFQALTGLPPELRLEQLCWHVFRLDRDSRRYRLRLDELSIGPDRGPIHRLRCLRALASFGQVDDSADPTAEASPDDGHAD